MKALYFFCLLLFSYPSAAFTKCGSAVWAFPEKSLPENGFILFFASGAEQELLDSKSTSDFYLISGGNKIKLQIDEILQGELDLTQALLVPETAPELGKTYTLAYTSKEGKCIEVTNYLISKASSAVLPTVNANPTVFTEEKMELGCGPVEYVYFKALFDTSSVYVVKVKVSVEVEGKQQSTTFYLPIKSGLLGIGHGMCSGPFLGGNAGSFKAEFWLVDANRNTKQWGNKAIDFQRPV